MNTHPRTLKVEHSSSIIFWKMLYFFKLFFLKKIWFSSMYLVPKVDLRFEIKYNIFIILIKYQILISCLPTRFLFVLYSCFVVLFGVWFSRLCYRRLHFRICRGVRWWRIFVCISDVDGAFSQRVLFCGQFISLGGKELLFDEFGWTSWCEML